MAWRRQSALRGLAQRSALTAAKAAVIASGYLARRHNEPLRVSDCGGVLTTAGVAAEWAREELKSAGEE